MRMRNRSLIDTVLIFVCGIAFFGSTAAQTADQVETATFFEVRTNTVPATTFEMLKQLYAMGASSSGGHTFHRIIADPKNRTFFGYDLVVQKQDGTSKLLVTFKPLSETPNQLLKRRAPADNTTDYDTFTAQSLPKYPEALILDSGDTITLDIFENPQTKAKISDVITITSKPLGPRTSSSERLPAKDFGIEDVNLRFDSPDILINGEKSNFGGGASGPVIWFNVFGKGRFIFSFAPQLGYNFQKTGTILDNKILFEHDGQRYEIVNKSPVLGSGGKWNLWVMFDPAYQPLYKPSANSPYEFGAADKVEYLFDARFRKPKELF